MICKDLTRLIGSLSPEAGLMSVSGPRDGKCAGITYDSREAREGWLFVALSGHKADGHEYVPDALARGASAVVVSRDPSEVPGLEEKANVTVIAVRDSRRALADISREFYDDPTSKLTLVGVTGTNGKTTTTFLMRAIFEKAGYKTGLVGTIQYMVGDEVLPSKNTTPESLDLQRMFRAMVDRGVTHVAMEVSSHAIAMGRIVGSRFSAGIFTNLTQDHLDFHGTLENYAATKARFFASLAGPGDDGGPAVAVVNADDPYHRTMIADTRARVVKFGVDRDADYLARDIKVGGKGTSFVLMTPSGEVPVRLGLAGRFNVYNSLGAIACAVSLGIPLEVAVGAAEELKAVSGRFELVDQGQDFTVVVDYAHTPDGLENVLRTARALSDDRLISVFGCGGDRDRGKRPIMGEIAAKYSDIVIVTSDNPRSEDPEAICREIEPGVAKGMNSPEGYRIKDYRIQVDRRKAIAMAISLAKPGDTVVIAGKGHETYQIFRDRTIHFDDREVAREFLSQLERTPSGHGHV